jgi:tetratricopeptide (TPR) repeat protein
VTQARAARKQRDFAVRQLARADAINGLNAYLLSDAAPSGKPFTVNDLLRRAEGVVEAQRGGDPATHVELLMSIGRQYAVQDEYGNARRLLEKAHSLAMALPEPSIRVRAACALGQALSRSGDSARAEALFQEAERTPLEDPLFLADRVSCLLLGSEIAQNLGSARDGIERANAARRLIAESPNPSELQGVDADVILASAYSSAGQLAEACSTFEEAAARLSARGRDDTQRAATIFNNWGNALYKIGRPLEAERAFRRAIAAGRDGQNEDAISPLLLIHYGRVLRELERLP